MDRRLRIAMVGVGGAVALWAVLAIPGRATYGARLSGDEPQYLLSAISLVEDLDLDISDEIAEQRYRTFHARTLPPQTKPLAGGREVSPHDPLLPVLLAVPTAVGGWVGAKVFLAGCAGLLAALLVWTAVRRFAVPLGTAVLVVGGLALVPPLSVYATQVYPELLAALAVTVGVAALTGPLDRRGRWLLGAAVVALPWLSVKYAPVALTLAAVGLVRLLRGDGDDRAAAGRLAAALGAAAVVFALGHRAIYGGWTAYATGDHFVDGELTVAGVDPDYASRSVRLVGLLLDRGFGLAVWAPAFLLGVAALAALARRRPEGWTALALPLGAGWLTATFVALTMHGWWWPGRQVVVVAPALVLVMAWWVTSVRWARPAFLAATAAGLVAWGWLLVELWSERLTLIVDFERTADPLVRAARTVLPDYRDPTMGTWVLHTFWLVALVVLAVVGWRTAGRPGAPSAVRSPRRRLGAGLSALLLALTAVGLAGCGDDDGADVRTDPQSEGTGSGSGSGTGTGSGSGTGTADTSGSGGGY